MRLTTVFTLLAAVVAGVVAADTAPTCNSTVSCPEKYPCCSQYGSCGTGAFCLGGCDVRFSFNLTSCMPMPRMSSFNTTFSDTDLLQNQNDYLGNASESDWIYSGYIATNDGAMLLQMPKESVGTVISSTKYLWYGRIGVNLKTSRGGGVVTAFILFSDVQDEIDFEYVGYNLTDVQTNFYSQGVTNYTNSRNYTTSDTFENYHFYEIDWQPDYTDWYIDGTKVRTLLKADTYNATSGHYQYPQTPARVQMSLWPGGASSNAPGTIEWAGGAIDWNSQDIQKYGYDYAYLKNISIEVNDLPSNATKDGSGSVNSFNAFLYTNKNGTAKDITLTNKKTWLGNGGATGFNPQNGKNKTTNSTTTIINSSGTVVSTIISTESNNVPENGGPANQQQVPVASTVGDYTSGAGVNGFVQGNAKQTGTTADGQKSTNAGLKSAEGMFGVVGAIIIGVISYLV